jgi:hypothetical protein
MSDLPKLKVTWWGDWEATMTFEQAKTLPFSHAWIFAKGKKVNSYEELAQLAALDDNDKEFLEVMVVRPAAGG